MTTACLKTNTVTHTSKTTIFKSCPSHIIKILLTYMYILHFHWRQFEYVWSVYQITTAMSLNKKNKLKSPIQVHLYIWMYKKENNPNYESQGTRANNNGSYKVVLKYQLMFCFNDKFVWKVHIHVYMVYINFLCVQLPAIL